MKHRQNPHDIGCLRSSFPMVPVVGEKVGTGDMKPMSGAAHPHAGFIDMENLGTLQEFSDMFFNNPGQVSGALSNSCDTVARLKEWPKRSKTTSETRSYGSNCRCRSRPGTSSG